MKQKYSLATNIATLGILGRTRFAPGTLGSFVAVWLAPLCFLPFDLPIRIAILGLLFLLGVYVSDIAAKELGYEDPNAVIIDEVLGQWITLSCLPNFSYFNIVLFSNLEFILLLVGFLLFRIFDITKIGPVGLMERKFHGGYGIMLDDVMAGVLALVFLYPITLYTYIIFL